MLHDLYLGSTGHWPVAFGSLPNASWQIKSVYSADSRQAAANYRPAACAPQKNKSLLHRWLNFSGGFATSDARAALPFLLFAFLMSDPKSSASAELAQACARRARATLCK
jgi:hypothetical protein